MIEVKLTAKGKAFKVGFKGADGKSSAVPLGERSQEDLKTFLIIAHRSRADYVALFDNPPSLQDLLKEQAYAKLKAGPDAGVYTTNPAQLPEGVPAKVAAPEVPAAAAEEAAPKASTAAPESPAQESGKAPTKS